MTSRFKHLSTLKKDNPVVFLDIDGVLNSGWFAENLGRFFDRLDILEVTLDIPCWVELRLLSVFTKVMKSGNAQVVVVSSWLNDNLAPDDENVKKLSSFLNLPVVGSLVTSGCSARGESVRACIDELGLEQWVLIDDREKYYDGLGLDPGRCIFTDPRTGLSVHDFEKLDRLLQISTRGA